MGAINWIDSNPTTAVIHANEARDAQQAQIENQLLAARDQRRAAADADRNSALAANAMLAKNTGLIASFSRALTEGLSAQQTEAEFNDTLDASIESIYQASIT